MAATVQALERNNNSIICCADEFTTWFYMLQGEGKEGSPQRSVFLTLVQGREVRKHLASAGKVCENVLPLTVCFHGSICTISSGVKHV
jgi:hypothetical protein